MKKTVVINVAGLTKRLIGEHTPFLKKWAAQAHTATIRPPMPAVTCTSQATYLTGQMPDVHGIVGNGWYFRDECEVKFWRQSNKLVQAPKLWEIIRQQQPDFTCANLFWWYNMYSSADFSVTPRPQYLSDGRKLPDCYAHPADLRDRLQAELGTFPLFDFWGPRTTIKSSQWIAEASKRVEQWHSPTLTLIYLPHLDYNLQRYGLDFSKIQKDLQEIDQLLADLITFYENRQAQVILLSEYGITSVTEAVDINRVLRRAGYIAVRNERGTELLDAGASRAFAVADHQIAHVYVQNPADIPNVRALLEQTPGIEQVWDKEEKRIHHLTHERSGELVAIANKNAWFTYYYWLDDADAPDFARIVDIHRKPGYDPVEMFTNPNLKLLKVKVGWTLLKKKLGFRYLMDIIPLDGSLVRGSHGRYPDDDADAPVLLTRQKELLSISHLKATEVFEVLVSHIRNGR